MLVHSPDAHHKGAMSPNSVQVSMGSKSNTLDYSLLCSMVHAGRKLDLGARTRYRD